MSNVYSYRRRRRDPFAKLYAPGLVLVALLVGPHLGDTFDPEKPAARAKPAPYIKLQSRSDDAEYESAERPASYGTAFRNCTEARAAGREDIPADDPRYGAHLDSDGDGLGCEPLPPKSRRR